MFRIALVGGSTTEGIGNHRGPDTIPAILEKALNENPAMKGRRVQALNFGVATANTSSELIKCLTQIVHFYPDMIISLDGTNDAWDAVYFPRMVGLPHGIINWPEAQYHQFDLTKDVQNRPDDTPLKIAPFTSSLLSIFLPGRASHVSQEKKLRIYEQFPLFRHSAFLQQTCPYNEGVFFSNLDALATVCRNRGIYFLSYLQPYSKRFKTLTPEEAQRVDSSLMEMRRRAWYGFAADECEAQVGKAFAAYAHAFRMLSSKYASEPNVRFFNIDTIFEKEPRTVFVDFVHYNALGNQIIAKRYENDVLVMLKAIGHPASKGREPNS